MKSLLDVGEFRLTEEQEHEAMRHAFQFKQLIQFLDVMRNGKVICFNNCKKRLFRSDIVYYRNHNGGISVPFEDHKAWVYTTHDGCFYQTSWWKIMNRYYKELPH